jgi:hypothetical protein
MGKFLTVVGSIARGAVVLGVLAMALHGVWQTTRQVRPPRRDAGPDFVSYNEEKYRAAREFLAAQAPAGTSAGLLGYLPVYTEPGASKDARAAAYYGAQFVMIPWTLEPALRKPMAWAVADFLDAPPPGWAPPNGWAVERNFGSVAVLRRVSGGDAR